jgi:hypothetical protein
VCLVDVILGGAAREVVVVILGMAFVCGSSIREVYYD